jgi:hypothetical protein
MFSGIWDIFCVIYGHSVRGGMRFDAEALQRREFHATEELRGGMGWETPEAF